MQVLWNVEVIDCSEKLYENSIQVIDIYNRFVIRKQSFEKAYMEV